MHYWNVGTGKQEIGQGGSERQINVKKYQRYLESRENFDHIEFPTHSLDYCKRTNIINSHQSQDSYSLLTHTVQVADDCSIKGGPVVQNRLPM